MTLPPDNFAEHETREAIQGTAGVGGENAAASSDTSEGGFNAQGGVEQSRTETAHPLIDDIRSGLVDMEAREEELRRREQQCARQEHLLELLSQVDFLDVKQGGAKSGAGESIQQRALVEALATLVEQEAEGTRQHRHISSRIAGTLVRVSQHKKEIVARLRQVREEIERHQQDLVLQRTDLERHGREVDRRIQELDCDQKLQEERTRELAQSERELAQRAELLEQQAGGLSEKEEQLRVRAVMLEASGAENERRADRIVEIAAELDKREHSLATRGADIGQKIEEFESRAEQQKQRAVELDNRTAEVQARAAQLDIHEKELSERAQTQQMHQAKLSEEARRLDDRTKQLAGREAAIEARENELQKRVEKLDSQTRELEQRVAELEQRDLELAGQAESLEARGKKLDDVARKLSSKKAELVAYGEKLEQGRRELKQKHAELSSRRGELDGRREELEKQRDEVDRNARAELEQQAEQLVQREAELEKRRESIEQLQQEARRAQEHIRLKEQEVAELQERLAARESNLSRETLQLEVDREQLQQGYTDLATEQEKLAQLQLEVSEAPTEASDSEPVYNRQPVQAETNGFRRRAVTVTAVASVIAGLVWYLLDQPHYRGICLLEVTTTRGLPRRIIGEHADAIMSHDLSGYWKGNPDAELWSSARASNQLEAQPQSDRGRIQVSYVTADRGLAETLLPVAAQAYIASVDARSLEAFRSPREIEWLERHAALSQELKQSKARCEEIEARLAELPAAADRESLQQTFDQALDEFERTVADLREHRDEMLALQSRERPRGQVTPEQYQETLEEDALYQEDLKEFASEARQYRTELAVAMVLLDEPLRELRDTVRKFSTTLIEQNDLQPPPNVRVFLEKCRSEVDDFDGFLAEFSQGWSKRRETIERLKVTDQVVELFNQQTQAMDAAGRLTTEALRVRQDIINRVDDLSASGNSGTREIVVTSLVRGDMSRMTEQIELLAEAADATNPAKNFRIDAHDRQLRGLRTRLRDRQEAVRLILQEEADEIVNQSRTERQSELRQAIAEIEQQRQQHMDTLVTSLQKVRELDRLYKELSELSAELRAERAATARMTTRMEQLESQRPPAGRDVVKFVGSEVEQIAGRNRVRNASLFGGGTFAIIGFLFLLTFAARPRGVENA